MLTSQQTAKIAQAFVDHCRNGSNAGFEACILNTKGDLELMKELFAVRGFRDLLKTALPEDQHEIGALKTIPAI